MFSCVLGVQIKMEQPYTIQAKSMLPSQVSEQSENPIYVWDSVILSFQSIEGPHWLWIMGNQFDILEALGMPLCQIWLIFFILFGMLENGLLNYVYLYWKQNQHIWNFHGSLTLNNGKLNLYFRSPCFVILSNITHFVILFGMSACFELCVTPVLTQNQDIRNFYGSLTLNNGKLIRNFRSP